MLFGNLNICVIKINKGSGIAAPVAEQIPKEGIQITAGTSIILYGEL